ncbi:MAG TPA: S9 family peptidase [Thermoanaerobaculia bacterium]|nr:S9 family peptidase [Thermoanaerobaculia bacterium]
MTMRTICRRQDALSPARTAAGTGCAGVPRGGWWARWARLALLAGFVVPAAVAGAAGRAAEPARRPIAETDLFRFVWVADPQISRDGRHVAFVRVTVDAKHDGYETALWLVDADAATEAGAGAAGAGAAAGPRPLTAGPRDSAPRWSPDGRRLAFLRHAGKGDQLFVLPLDGGEARQLTDLPGGAESPAWSPDGRTLAFLSETSAADLAKPGARGKEAAEPQPVPPAPPGGGAAGFGPGAAGLGAGAAGAAGANGDAAAGLGAAPAGTPAAEHEDPLPEHQSDVRVISRAVYRLNGAGYLDPFHPDHLWTVEVPEGGAAAPPPRQLTRGELAEQGPAWAPDGSHIYLISDRVKEPYYQDAAESIYAVPAAGGELVKVASFTGGIASLAVSPDGRQIAFIGASVAKPTRSYDQPDLWVVASAPGGEPRNLTAAFDFDIGAHLLGDQHPPRGAGRDVPAWSADGSSLIVPAEERGRVELRRFEIQDGRSRQVTTGDHEVMSYSAAPDGSRLALVISTPTAIGDLFALDLPAAAAAGAAGTGAGTGAAGATAAAPPLRQLTHFNDALFARLTLTPPQAITYRSFDGREIEAWVQRPPGYPAGKPYPMILDIHGGPHGAYGYTFFHETQWMAAKGYVVIYPNPRGSTAYGQEFGNVIQYRYPGDDFKDLMAGVDELVRRGDVDPKRLGVTGGSGGGLLTNWTITQTDRFAAAVSQRSIADWAGWWYTADFTLFTPRWFRGAPFEEPQDFTARSPITFIKNVKTPLMLIEGEADYRTPPAAGGETMFRALKYLHRPVVMVLFPGESHELSRSGHPWHRVERLQHIVRWFDKYLKGEKTDLYDVP